jgi:hypothetical protein
MLGNQPFGIVVNGAGMDLGQPGYFTGRPFLADEFVKRRTGPQFQCLLKGEYPILGARGRGNSVAELRRIDVASQGVTCT